MDRSEVDEYILAAVLRGDEPEPLVLAEPLHSEHSPPSIGGHPPRAAPRLLEHASARNIRTMMTFHSRVEEAEAFAVHLPQTAGDLYADEVTAHALDEASRSGGKPAIHFPCQRRQARVAPPSVRPQVAPPPRRPTASASSPALPHRSRTAYSTRQTFCSVCPRSRGDRPSRPEVRDSSVTLTSGRASAHPPQRSAASSRMMHRLRPRRRGSHGLRSSSTRSRYARQASKAARAESAVRKSPDPVSKARAFRASATARAAQAAGSLSPWMNRLTPVTGASSASLSGVLIEKPGPS
ncbi:hypothetical protein SAMN05216532_8060 [Streptomyces sp. 2231.1]|nr:hypothetical protein SAMN05216532_8060 [Streptomyces sp. 2231.1]